MLQWKEIKSLIEGNSGYPVTDETRLSYITVSGTHIGFGVVPQEGIMVNLDGMIKECESQINLSTRDSVVR